MRRWIFWVGLFISVVLLVLALGGLSLDEVWRDLQQSNPWWIVPGVAVYFVSVAVRCWRWGYLLRPAKLLSVRALYPIVAIGYMGNNIYPARIGELLRAYVLRRRHEVPIAFSLSTVLLERIVDGLVMVGFVLIGLPRVPNLPTQVLNVIGLLTVALVAAIAVFFALALAPDRVETTAGVLLNALAPKRFRSPLAQFVARFVQGARALRRPTDLLAIVLSTVLIWLIETLKYWFIMHAFGLETHLDYVDLMLVNGAANLFTIIPAAPGFVGTFDFAGIGTLTALGVDRASAAAYTLVLHAVLWLPVTALGAFFMLREGLRWADLQQAERTVRS
ncbi:MAG: lysylphosphatidylglycerol synthase transmembrane domain-containing protein [Anaerolineae bacterium]|nr:flippase-like domain-containing protein [Thermoflexales bacterium]MDW8407890.1 lysylphosphatidylglycerol synthase transmembrane domain-containing protein [Anaerolineae bacterium]